MQDRTTGGGTAVALSARYTADGERIEKSDPFTGTKISSFGLFDTKTKGGVAEGTLHTPGISFRNGLNVSGGAVGTTGTDRFFHTDQLGSTRHLTNGTGTGTYSTTPSRMRFDAYGLPTQLEGADGWDATEYQYAGAWGYEREPHGSRLGLDYLYQRYYDPAVGKFISADPIGIAGGLNLYAYCENDPVNAVDPSGLDAMWAQGPVPNDPWGLERARIYRERTLHRLLSAIAISLCSDVIVGANQHDRDAATLRGLLNTMDRRPYPMAPGGPTPPTGIRVHTSSPPTKGLWGRDYFARTRSERIKPIVGIFDFAIHGSPTATEVRRPGGTSAILDHRSVANAMRAAGYRGGPVRLISCSTGALPDGFAQRPQTSWAAMSLRRPTHSTFSPMAD